MQVKILPSRQALVDRIELQYEYGQSIVTLLGGPGLGKSYILESFVTDKYTDLNKIYLQLNHKTSNQQVISQLLEQSFSQPLIDFSQSLSENYLNLSNLQASKNTVIVIDNAQFLSEELANEIDFLTQIPEITLYVLTASTSKLNLKNSANIYFEALSFDESIELMSMYFSQLPNKHEPVFKAFVESAQGIPALLLSWDSNSVKIEVKKSKHGFMLLCLAFVVLTTVALSYIFESLSQNGQIESLRELNDKNEEQKSGSDKLANENEKHAEQVSEAAKLNGGKTQSTKKTTVTKKFNSEETQNPNKINTTVKLDSDKNQNIDVIKIVKVDKISESKISKVTISETEHLNENKLNSTIPHSIDTSLEVQLLAVESVVMPAQTPITNNNVRLKAKVEQNDYDNSWFVNQQESLVMLQLIGVSQEHLINQFISDNTLENIKIYKSTRYGGDWWVVTVGPFKDIQQSQAYKNSLSAQLKQLKPFSKKIKAIKTEIALLKSI